MATKEGFTIEISSRYEGWWRYNVALMCGCFDTAGNRTGFASTEAHVADVGSNLREKPAGNPGGGRASLETGPCDHLLLYIYIVPHTLPAGNDIGDTTPFEVEIRIAYGGRRLRAGGPLIQAAPRGETPHQPVVGRLDRDARGFRSPVAGIPGQHPPSRNTLPGRATSAPPQPQKKKEPTRVPSSIIATAYDYLLL